MILITITGHVRKNKPVLLRYCGVATVGQLELVPVMAPFLQEMAFCPHGFIAFVFVCLVLMAYPTRGFKQLVGAVFVLYLTTWGNGRYPEFLIFPDKGRNMAE